MTISLAPARAAASRRNGAKSRGPKSPEGKTRSAQNALKHGLRAEKFVTVGDESAQEFAALESALVEELAPDGVLQRLLASRIARAAWRLERAERIEVEMFAVHGDGNLGLALIRDGNGSRAFDTFLRYRGSAMAELWRSLRLLKALQSEADRVEVALRARGTRSHAPRPAPRVQPIEPEVRTDPGETAPGHPAGGSPPPLHPRPQSNPKSVQIPAGSRPATRSAGSSSRLHPGIQSNPKPAQMLAQ